MKLKFEYKITLLYLILGSLWILFSDKLLYYFVPDAYKLTHVQTYKGWFFIVATATLFFLFIKKHLTEKRKIDFEIKKKTEEYYALYEEYRAQAENLDASKSKLEETLHNFELVLENAPIPIFIQTEGKFSYVNAELCNMYGVKKSEEITGTPVLDRIHPDYKDLVKERIQNLNSNKMAVPKLEYKQLRIDQTPIDVEVMAVPFRYYQKDGALFFVRDITSIKKYIREIEEQNYFIQNVLDNLPIGIALNKFDRGVATYINKKFEEIYGWPAHELKDITTFFNKVYPDEEYRNKIVQRITKDIESGKPENMHWENIEITQKTGEKRYVNAVNIPLAEQNTMVSTVMDITPQKQFEKDLIIAKEKSEESNRLKTAFLNNISHEFRTPLNGMLGFLDLAMQEDLEQNQKEEYFGIIKESSNKFLNILTDVIEISQIQSKTDSTNSFSKCNINQLIDNVIQDKQILIRKKGLELKVTKDCNQDELLINTDEYKLERSLMHILDNAIKFTQKGTIEFICKRNEYTIEIQIKDTGIGIAPEAQSMIFQPFRQIEVGETRNYGGNGIGLSIVQSYIHHINGTVSLESELDKGTNVILKIPVDYSPNKKKSERSKNNRAINWSDYTILIVEDDKTNYLYLNEVVSGLGAKTLYAKNGLQALELCKENDNIDLILMDIKMPEMNGYEATKLIKEVQPNLTVIAQSAYATENEINKYKDVFDSYITKPIDVDMLVKKLIEYLQDSKT
ncbi:MAG: PAS domain S-box protein [Bacteroidetes bacterium]|nr:PAS domain S-box protein [Bacteroidota bacterium]